MTALLKQNHKKYLLSGFMLTLLIFVKTYAATIKTNSDGHWYIGGLLGTHFSSNGDTQIPSIASKPPLTSEPVYHAGSAAGVNVGYQFPQSFRIESELAYQNLPMNKINNAIGAGTVTYVNHSYTNLFSIFINGYYDFNLFYRWVPYIGLGAGYVDVKNKIKPATPIPVAPGLFFTKKEINYNTWGYQGMIGIIYQLTDRIDASVDYKYFSALKQEATGQTNLGADGYQTKQKITDNMVSLGIKYFLA